MILRRHAGCRDNSFFASPRGSERVSLCCPAVCRVRLSRCNPIARFAYLVAGRAWGRKRSFCLGLPMNCKFGIHKVEVGKARREDEASYRRPQLECGPHNVLGMTAP